MSRISDNRHSPIKRHLTLVVIAAYNAPIMKACRRE